MIRHEDLLPEATDKYLQLQTKLLQDSIGKLDMKNQEDKWIAVTYIYGLNNGLKEYQARSFASELTLFLTNKIYNTDVSFAYREDWIDSLFYNKFQELEEEHKAKDKDFWQEFIGFMIGFYKSNQSWKYERVSKYLQFRITEEERAMFDLIPRQKPKEKFIYLLEYFQYDLHEIEYRRRGVDLDRTFSINLTVGEYDRFMQVLGDTKTQKFLNLLYYWFGHLSAGNVTLND
jgi:hypothetical protein